MELFEIVETELDINTIVKKVSTPSAGGIATFIGVTRDFTGPYNVSYLFYEAYDTMAIHMMRRIADDAIKQFDIEKMAISHRIGKVAVEEISVVIAVSAAHREASFKACQYAIDTLKEIVPIWKKEHMVDGQEKWIANDAI